MNVKDQRPAQLPLNALVDFSLAWPERISFTCPGPLALASALARATLALIGRRLLDGIHSLAGELADRAQLLAEHQVVLNEPSAGFDLD